VPDSVSCLAALSACARASPPAWEPALELARRMEGRARGLPPPDARALAALYRALGRAGQWERVVSLLDEAEAAGRVSLNEFHYSACLEACATAPGKAPSKGPGKGWQGQRELEEGRCACGGPRRKRWSAAQGAGL